MKKVRQFLAMVLFLCVVMGMMTTMASATTTLTIINLTVDEPVAGKSASATTASLPSNARSTVEKLEWTGKFDSTDTFLAGERYTATVTMGIKKGADCIFSSKSISAKVNGKAADKVEWYADDKVVVIYTFPAASSTSSTVLKEAKITLTAPETGKTPATTATVPSDADYTVKKVEWKGALSNGKFKENTSYTAYVTLGIKSGKNATFSDKSFNAYVNGTLMDEVTWNSDTEIVVWGTFDATKAATGSSTGTTRMRTVRITIDSPVIGELPAETATLGSTSTSNGCYVKSVKWTGKLNMWDKFQGGQTYTATITLGVKSGKNTIYSPDELNVYVNGTLMDQSQVTRKSDKEVVVVAEFEKTAAPTIINEVSLTITSPVTGKAPDTSPRLPKDAPYFVNKITWSGLSGGKFQAGKSHTAKVTLQIHSDKNTWFSDKTLNVYVNGTLLDEVEWHSNNEIYFPVTFEGTDAAQTTAPTVLKEAKITLTAPETGKTPAKTAAVPSSADYTVKKVEWTGSLSSGKFKANTSYTAKVTLGIKSGKNAVFADDAFNAYVNDYLINEITWNSASEIVVPVVFEKTGAAQTTAPTVLKEAKITLTAPETGKTPAKTATVPSSADYTVKNVEWKGALSDGKFKASTSYTAYVTLGIKSGKNATFSDKSFNAYVNDTLMDEVTWNSDTEIVVWGTFEKTGPAPASGNSSSAKTSFTDVPASAYYAQPVVWAVDRKITTGTSDTTFSPGNTCTQAQILTFLWRAAGSPEPQGTVEMEGFTGTEYYYKAAQWAAERDMVGGEFNPGAPCTRAMAVTFMWKYAGSPAAAAASFTDVPAGADYAGAVAWAVAKGVTTGTSDTTFSPDQTCTRAQIVTFLHRAFAG